MSKRILVFVLTIIIIMTHICGVKALIGDILS